MGLDAIFQAIPDDRKLLELAKTDWNWLFALTSPTRHRFKSLLRQFALNRDGGEKFIQEFDNYFDRQVDVFGISLKLGRKWDSLSYLLVERRRVYSLDDALAMTADNNLIDLTDRDKMYFRALMGGDWLHDSEIIPRGKQCDRPRYMPSDEVKTISDQFDKMTFDDLLQHYSDEKMANAFIYKFHPNYERNKEYIIEAFVLLRDFYSRASLYKAGVLFYLI